jgi:transglutaminase-like putative cysteine protease
MKPWDAKGKALMMVSHVTRLSYSEPVVEAHSEVRKSPVDTGLQRVVTHKVEIDPPARVGRYQDSFGSDVRYFNLLEPHDGVEIRATSVVETTDAICCGPSYDLDTRSWTEKLTEYIQWSASVPLLPEYQEIPNRVEEGLSGEDFVAALSDLGATFRSRFRYDPDATDVHSSPAELLAKGGGVCQDLTHAMLGVLRLSSVPCRYVSGYLFDPATERGGESIRGAAASHAWVQAWHRDLGWIGIDPTNNKLVDWQYVRVAVGRDYSDVQPVRGVFLGTARQSLGVEVEVKRIG